MIQPEENDSVGRDAAPTRRVAVLQGELRQAVRLVLTETQTVLDMIDFPMLEQAAGSIVRAERVFVVGEGRSGLAIRMFAMRLMHLGCQVYVMGETTTPAMRKGDTLIAFSGSGGSGVVTLTAENARAIGGHIIAVTTQPGSPLAARADLVVNVPAAAKQDRSTQHSKQFAGSLFEQAALLLFDSLFHALSVALKKDHTTLWAMHTNLT